jgi:hypothetical protein
MKIHFREVDGKSALYAEIEDQFYHRKTKTFCSSLPGRPRTWEDVPSHIKTSLSFDCFLDVKAENDETQGEAFFLNPSPRELWERTFRDIWEKTYAEAEGTAWNREEFLRFANWWEYLRRSKKFIDDCQALKQSLSSSTWLAWVAFARMAPHALHLGTCYVLKELGCIEHTISHDAVHPAKLHGSNCYEKMKLFCFKWDLPLLESLLFLNHEETTALDIASSWMCINKIINNDPVSELCKEEGWGTVFSPRLFRKDRKSENIEYNVPKNLQEGKEISFQMTCSHETASQIVNTLFQHRLPVSKFDFISKLSPWNKQGIKFGIAASYNSKEGPQKRLPEPCLPILGTLHELYHFDALEFKTWSERDRLNADTIQKETVAFDQNTDLDELLWPGLTKRSLSSKKSALKKEASERISRIEDTAANREQIAPHVSSLKREIRLEDFL